MIRVLSPQDGSVFSPQDGSVFSGTLLLYSFLCVCVRKRERERERERERGREKAGGERRSLVVVAWVMKKVSFVFD